MTKFVKVQEAKTHLSALLKLAESGEEVVISRGPVPIARLVPMTATGPRDWASCHTRCPTRSSGICQRDPFDRMLAAQAMVESMTLFTQDEAFATVRGIRTLW